MIEVIKNKLFDIAYYFMVGDVDSRYKKILFSKLDLLTSDNLRLLLKFCKENNSYYKKVSKSSEIRLEEFPVLTKDIIRNNSQRIISDIKGNKVYKNSSGGSTGQPIKLLQDQNYNLWSNATEKYYYKRFLKSDCYHDSKVVLWGSERDSLGQRDIKAKVYQWLSKTTFLNTFNVNNEALINYIEKINQVKPFFVKGYAGSLYEVAKIINRNQIKMYRPKFVYSSAELLRNFMRKEIERAFKVKVYDFYGSREVGAIAGECKFGHMHIFSFNNLVEIFDFEKDVPVEDGEVGRIIVTNLHNYTMPLIRYEIGDSGSISKKQCKCGSKLPWFKSLVGRVTDHFRNSDGDLIHGEYFTHLFYFRNWVDKFQVNQIGINEIEVLIIKKGKVALSDKDDIEKKIRLLMGKKCKITWNFVKNIPLTPQGKFLYTRNLLKSKKA